MYCMTSKKGNQSVSVWECIEIYDFTWSDLRSPHFSNYTHISVGNNHWLCGFTHSVDLKRLYYPKYPSHRHGEDLSLINISIQLFLFNDRCRL